MRMRELQKAACCLAGTGLFALWGSLAAYGQDGQNRDVVSITFPDAPSPVAAEQKLTLAQALDMALRDNPQIAQATHQVRSARNNLSGQRAPLNPGFTFAGLNNTVSSFSPTSPANYGLTYTVETSGRQGIRTQEARAQLQQTEADAETTRLSVRHATVSAYISLQVAEQALRNEQEAYTTAFRLRDLTRKQFEIETAPEADAIRAEIALTQEEQNLITAVGGVKQARAALNTELGRSPDTPIASAEPLEFHLVAVDLNQLQRQAAQNRPEIRSSQANERALAATVKMQRSQYYPDLALGSDLRFQGVLVGFTAPLFDFGGIRGAVRKAREDVKAQEAQTEQTRQQVSLQVQNAYDALVQARKAVLLYENKSNGILPRSASLLQRTRQGYSLGASTILDLITAQDTLRQARNSYYTAIGNYQQAVAQVENATGQTLPSPPRLAGLGEQTSP